MLPRLSPPGSPGPFVCCVGPPAPPPPPPQKPPGPRSAMHNAGVKMLTVANKNQRGCPHKSEQFRSTFHLRARRGDEELQLIVAFERRSGPQRFFFFFFFSPSYPEPVNFSHSRRTEPTSSRHSSLSPRNIPAFWPN